MSWEKLHVRLISSAARQKYQLYWQLEQVKARVLLLVLDLCPAFRVTERHLPFHVPNHL